MKLGALILAMIAFALPAGAQNVRCELLVVRVAQAEGMRLHPILRSERVAAGVGELRAMIANGKAELVGAPLLLTTSGGRGVTETIEEIRFATEFDPPVGPGRFNVSPAAQLQPQKPVHPVIRLIPPIDVPTAFETRNVGVTLEIEPTVASDGRTIEVNIVHQYSSHEGVTRLFSTTGGHDWRYQQPAFRTLGTTTSVTCISGEWRLLNASVLGAPARMEFFLIRVSAIPTPR